MKTIIHRLAALGLFAVVATSCTMKDQEAPPLTGPSEFGTSVTVQVTPDVLQQDGASQSVVIVTARDAAGQPIANLPLRAEIRFNGQAVDFGSLSSRNIVTGPDGRALLIYTAPAVAANVESLVEIAVTPLGTNFDNAVARTASIRLVPAGVVLPPSGLNPQFSFTPSNPSQSQNVFFDASASAAPATNPIASYEWDFGNGRTATGKTVTHAFSGPGTYFVRLTIRDAAGRSASTTQSVSVAQGAAPTASFTFSPTEGTTHQPVQFNASSSVAAPGRSIVSYRWDYGDPFSPNNADQGVQVAHAYSRVGTYTVTLTVTDDIGRTATTSRTVQVK